MARSQEWIIEERELVVHVKPNAQRTEIFSYDAGVLRIGIAVPATDNKANLALLKFLKKETGRPWRLMRGRTSRVKTVRMIE